MADYSYDAMGRLSSALGGGMRYDYRYYEGGAGQMNTIYSWGTLKEAGIILIWILLWLSKCRNKKVVNNMLNEKRKNKKCVIWKTEQNLEKYRDFHFGEFIEKPNQCGYFERNGNWYTYVIDERNFCTFTGPFNGSAIIYACSKVLHISKLFKEYKFTEQELKIYINNSFHSFGEIDKKSERHFDCK